MRFGAVGLLWAAAGMLAAAPVEFLVKLDPKVAGSGASGRLLVLMKKGQPKGKVLTTGFVPGETWLAAREIPFVAAGGTVRLRPDEISYPKPFGEAEAGEWSFMAVLDRDHSYALEGLGAGDLRSEVLTRSAMNPADTEAVALTLTVEVPARKAPADTENIKLVEFESAKLSAFFARPVRMQAGVVLPPGFGEPGKVFPAVYHVHGFGGDHTTAWRSGEAMVKRMQEGKRFAAVHVFLNASWPTGHHVFADSANNGPWGTALTTELIPYLETRFHLDAVPQARFLTGHSSGGWTTLWLQVAYPDFFGGTWPTAPDSVDFESFTGIDARPGSTQNAYLTKDGQPLYLVRLKGKDAYTMKDFVLQEVVTGEYGGQLASFDWVFSPRGADGRPVPLFNRVSGVLDPAVQEYWKKYDIAYQVRTRWDELGPKLRDKVRLVIGEQDTFHLEGASKLFCAFLASKGQENACQIVPERDHMDLYRPHPTYPDGLEKRIDDEMKKQYGKRPAQP